MHNVDGYLNTHFEVREIIKDLRKLFATGPLQGCGTAKTAYGLLCDLSERLHHHFIETNHGLYPHLLIHEDPLVNSLAWGFLGGERPLRRTFNAYCGRWLQDCQFNVNHECLTATRQVCALVEQRLDHEAQVLLPKLIEIGMFHRARRREIGGSSCLAPGRR